MYKKVSANLNFVSRELETIDFWKKNKVFEKTCTVNASSPDKVFTFFDGPPTANGKPHIGHVLTRAMKDVIPRYKIMKGFNVLRKAGWDTHGLPVEIEVEKTLHLDGKQDIEKYGIEPFIKQCKQSVWKYKGEWERMSERVGYWVDMEDPYITYDNRYIESVWWSLKKVFEKGLLYQGYKIVPYCPRCGTALSSHEVAQGYKDVKEKSIFVKFRLVGQSDVYFLAWTTTPWTLPSNVALCMNADEDYTKIKVKEEYYILADALVSSLFEEGSYTKIDTKKGSEYEYTPYERLFDCYKGGDKAFYITNDSYVTLTDGTGIVHIAPAFGEDDANVGREYKLPFVQAVDTAGKFTADAAELVGMFCKDADPKIIGMLADKGLLFKQKMYEHSYPFCWRCDSPLLYYARKSWFIKMTAVKDEVLKANNSVNWIPESIGTGRMGNFIENLIDWGISRERYWGTPLPIWICDKCKKIHVVGSKEELCALSGCDKDIELHRPYIDEISWKCECGGTMVRTPEVLDCWYDSGSMPFAQHHYPFENKEVFERNFPAQYISEAVDQTRGWFYTLLSISTLLFDKSPFENCIVLGHVNDKDGIKMSKHKGNVVDPWSALDKQGADAVRWYFYTTSNPWLPSRFSLDAVSEGQRRFMGTLWNTYAFFVLYADIDKFNPSAYDMTNREYSVMDKWILSKLNTLVKRVDGSLAAYDITDAARSIEEFTDILSNWYVRRSRERYWGKDMDEDKICAYSTLYTVLVTLSKLCAPFVPFVSEQIYGNLVTPFFKDAPISVHLCRFPECNEKFIDAELERTMDNLLDVVVLGRSARNVSNIKNRQPLARMYVATHNFGEFDEEFTEIIKNELNVKEVCFVSDSTDFISYELKPQLKTLGPKYGKMLNAIRQHLSVCNADEVVKIVKSGKKYEFIVDQTEIALDLDDLLISTVQKEGYVAASDKGISVVLDANVTEELFYEGIMREFVSKVQTMRKEADFSVTDHIEVFFQGTAKVEKTVALYLDGIKSDTLADIIIDGAKDNAYTKEWELNGENAVISVVKK
ncbi:MAG: isoleucine--tRNA ligase [Clostridia bacterium]|nr:isoleucine--tRNA ligase [Clostridia bacterium]